MRTYTTHAIETLSCPEGTTGLAIQPWVPGAIYAVAADWSNSASPVLQFGKDGWNTTSWRVADFVRGARDAMRCVLTHAFSDRSGISSEAVDEYEVTELINLSLQLADRI